MLFYNKSIADRGATKIPVMGGHTAKNMSMIMTTLPTHEVPKLQDHIQTIDETAFIIIMPATKVMGRGFSLQQDYLVASDDFITPL